MAGTLKRESMPVYPHHGELPDRELRTWIVNFFRISDNNDADELWIKSFTKDARVQIGALSGQGEQEIRAMRKQMWEMAHGRTHRVKKVFPGQFRDAHEQSAAECEVMLLGDVLLEAPGGTSRREWAAHGVLRRESQGEEVDWRFASWRVYI